LAPVKAPLVVALLGALVTGVLPRSTITGASVVEVLRAEGLGVTGASEVEVLIPGLMLIVPAETLANGATDVLPPSAQQRVEYMDWYSVHVEFSPRVA